MVAVAAVVYAGVDVFMSSVRVRMVGVVCPAIVAANGFAVMSVLPPLLS